MAGRFKGICKWGRRKETGVPMSPFVRSAPSHARSPHDRKQARIKVKPVLRYTVHEDCWVLQFLYVGSSRAARANHNKRSERCWCLTAASRDRDLCPHYKALVLLLSLYLLSLSSSPLLSSSSPMLQLHRTYNAPLEGNPMLLEAAQLLIQFESLSTTAQSGPSMYLSSPWEEP